VQALRRPPEMQFLAQQQERVDLRDVHRSASLRVRRRFGPVIDRCRSRR
jgi:hypothetical protein